MSLPAAHALIAGRCMGRPKSVFTYLKTMAYTHFYLAR